MAEFKKSSHRVTMTTVVASVLRRQVVLTMDTDSETQRLRGVAIRLVYKNFPSSTLRFYEQKTHVLFDDVRSILDRIWPSSSAEDVQATIECLVLRSFLVRTGRTKWRVAHPSYDVKDDLTVYIPDESTTWNKYRSRAARRGAKPGVCPVCRHEVGYRLRHKRSGKVHDGEACALNRVGDILQELIVVPDREPRLTMDSERR